MLSAAQSASAGSEQSQGAASELAGIAAELQSLVVRFRYVEGPTSLWIRPGDPSSPARHDPAGPARRL